MSYNPEAKSSAQMKYDAANTVMKHVKMNCKIDADILAYLENCPNFQGLVKGLIREKMKQDGFAYSKEE